MTFVKHIGETNRLFISPMTQDELQQLINQYRATVPELSSAYKEMLNNCKEHPEEHIWYTSWKFVDKKNGKMIGDAGFKGFPNNGHIEIGYGIYDEYQRKGFATEGVRALCRWAFEQQGVVAIEAETEADNRASQIVLFKNGFVATGELGKEGPRYMLKTKE